MSLKDRYTAIADALRSQYGTTDKYKLADMPALIDGLEIENLLDPGQSYDSKADKNKSGIMLLTGMTVEKFNAYVGKPLIFSFDVEYSGYKPDGNRNNRVGFEYSVEAEGGTPHWYGIWHYPKTANGKLHVAATIELDKALKLIDTAYIYNQINPDAHVKITNIKIVVDPVGGGSTA